MKHIYIGILFLISQNAIAQMDEFVEFKGEKLEVVRTYHDNGQLDREWTQLNDKLHGYHKAFYENGNKKNYKEYRNNKKLGVHSEWYENGEVKQVVEASNGNLQLLKYDENQNLISSMVVNEFLRPIGTFKIWHLNGNLKSEIDYNEKGKPIGISKSYYEDGSLQLETLYSEGEPMFLNQRDSVGKYTIKDGDGMLYKYNEDGSLYVKTEIKEGFRNGKSIIYKDGNIGTESTYVNGKTEGPTYWYYPNGKVKDIMHMKNGVMERAERNFPMYDNPVLIKSISIKPSKRRDEENKTFTPTIFPELLNLEEILESIDLTPSIYDNKPQELVITEVFRVYLTEDGCVKEYTRSVGSGYQVTQALETSLELMKFDMKNQTVEGIENEIWITFNIEQAEKE